MKFFLLSFSFAHVGTGNPVGTKRTSSLGGMTVLSQSLETKKLSVQGSSFTLMDLHSTLPSHPS